MGKISKRTILIINDDAKELKKLHQQCASLGIKNCTAAEEGFKGVQEIIKLSKQNRYFDLIIAKLRMAKINGFKLLVELRKRFPNRPIPYVVLLGKEDEDKLKKLADAGANGHILSPPEESNLKEVLKQVWKLSDKDFPAQVTSNPLVDIGQKNSSLENAFAIGNSAANRKKKESAVQFSFSNAATEIKKEKELHKKKSGFSFGGSSQKPKPEVKKKEKPKKDDKPKTPKKKLDRKKIEGLLTSSKGHGSGMLTKAAVIVPEDMTPGPMNKNDDIDGIYFKIIQLVHGLDINYFWAIDDDTGTVHLYLLTQKCKKSGIELEVVTKKEFCRTFFAVERYGCDLDGYEDEEE